MKIRESERKKLLRKLKQLEASIEDTNKRGRIVLFSLLCVVSIILVTGIFEVLIGYSFGFMEIFRTVIWFVLFNWTLFIVRSSSSKIMMVNNVFMLILCDGAVIISCLQILIQSIVLETIFWTIIPILVGYQLYVIYVRRYYKPWW